MLKCFLSERILISNKSCTDCILISVQHKYNVMLAISFRTNQLDIYIALYQTLIMMEFESKARDTY